VAPSSPFFDRGGILLARSLSWITRTKIVRHNGIESYRHAGTPTAAGDGSHARSLATGGTLLCFLLIEREQKTIRSGPLHWGLIESSLPRARQHSPMDHWCTQNATGTVLLRAGQVLFFSTIE